MGFALWPSIVAATFPAVRHFGRLDAVVAAAGVIGGGTTLWETPDAVYDAVMSVNVLGVRRLIEASVPTLLSNGRYGRIVAVASAASQLGLRHLAAYSAAKHGVVGLIRGVAMDLAETNITANAVSPGSTNTAMLEASARIYRLHSSESFVEQQPIGRLLQPSEVAASIAWLCSPQSSGMTGANLAVDGGMTVN